MGDLSDGYRQGAAWDEVFDRDGTPHPESAALYAALQRMSADDLSSQSAQLTRAFRDQGITFSLSGEERTFPLDLVPRVVTAGEQRVIKDGIVPRRVVVSSSAHCRAHEAYLRTYRAAVEPEKVVELLVMDRALSS